MNPTQNNTDSPGTSKGLRFVYCNTAGEISERALSQWQEAGHYIKGHDEIKGRVLTFRKDRVQQYLEGSESLLKSPHAAPPPKLARQTVPDERPQILFTGFARAQRDALEAKADAHGVRVVQTVTNKLTFLCGGPNAGPAKVEKARSQGVYIVTESQLHPLLETGELLDEVVDAC